MIPLLGPVVVAWASLVVCVETVGSCRALARPFPSAPRAPSDAVRRARVLVVRPCAGDRPWLLGALVSLAGARGSFSMSTRIAVASATDRALPAALASAEALAARELDSSVVITGARGPNRKADQLSVVVAAEVPPPDVVLVADSDVDLTGTDLDELIAPLLQRGGAAAVWAPPVESSRGDTIGDRASMAVLAGSLHAFPILSGIDRAGLVGKLFAVRRDALEAVGGFGALVSFLGEDVELARRLRAAGLRVVASAVVAQSLVHGRSWRQVEARFARWISVIRAQRPALLATYPLLFFPTVPLALGCGVVFSSVPTLGAVLAGLVVAARLAVAVASARRATRRPSVVGAFVDALLGDALIAAAFVRALRSRRVAWGDAALTIDEAGRLRDDGIRPEQREA